MKRLYPLKPHAKKGRDPLPLRTPQYAGSPGWILLTHNDVGEPTAVFMDSNDKPTTLPIVLDERVFSDTVLRVTRLSKDVFLVCDLRYLNGKFVYPTMTYTQRQNKIEELLDLFHYPDMTALIVRDGVPEDTPIRGWETYDDLPGTMGVFIPADE
jgi:hypothetical protein